MGDCKMSASPTCLVNCSKILKTKLNKFRFITIHYHYGRLNLSLTVSSGDRSRGKNHHHARYVGPCSIEPTLIIRMLLHTINEHYNEGETKSNNNRINHYLQPNR